MLSKNERHYVSYLRQLNLSMDFIGPFRTFSESRYILVKLHKCAHVGAKEAACALFEHFGKFGAPSQMSDRGSHFINQVISAFLAYVGTEHCLSRAYSKEVNAIVERANIEINRDIPVMWFNR